jgi:hypothetical protein
LPDRVRQCLSALAVANRIRLSRAAVHRAVQGGEMTVGAALHAAECQTARLIDLLAWQHQWGPIRVQRLLNDLWHDARIPETATVGQVTDRQRALLLEALYGDHTSAAA